MLRILFLLPSLLSSSSLQERYHRTKIEDGHVRRLLGQLRSLGHIHPELEPCLLSPSLRPQLYTVPISTLPYLVIFRPSPTSIHRILLSDLLRYLHPDSPSGSEGKLELLLPRLRLELLRDVPPLRSLPFAITLFLQSGTRSSLLPKNIRILRMKI